MKSSGSAFVAALAASFGPTPEREQHDRITRDSETLADSDGGIGLPWRAESLLERLERRGDIGPREREAGEEFARLFRRAHLDPLKAADPARGIRRSRPEPEPHESDQARRRVIGALDTLGGQSSPCGCCAWFVLGNELSMEAWARREGWANRPIRPEVAKGILIGTLSILSRHFGTT